jgi:hypothetical protein
MTKPITPPVPRRKRGNPNWGSPIIKAGPSTPTAFELQVAKLRLTPEMYVYSRELRTWCERNRDRVYVPEWLLDEWAITVEPIFSGPTS